MAAQALKIGEQRIAVIEERPRRQLTANHFSGNLRMSFKPVWFGLVGFSYNASLGPQRRAEAGFTFGKA